MFLFVPPDVPSIELNSVYERSCCGETETGYNISFIVSWIEWLAYTCTCVCKCLLFVIDCDDAVAISQQFPFYCMCLQWSVKVFDLFVHAYMYSSSHKKVPVQFPLNDEQTLNGC